MKTAAEELAKLAADTEQKKEEIARKHAVLSLLGDLNNYAPPFVHHTKLYGKAGSLSFKMQRYSSIAEKKSPDRALLADLMQRFPPMGKVMVKDGCTSFRPASGQWKGEVLEVNPVTVRLEVFQGPTAQFEWNALLDGHLWEFQLEYSLHSTDLGELQIERTYADRWHNHPTGYSRCEFIPKHGAQRIRWASGGKEYPNSFTLYWDKDSGNAVNFPELINAVET